MITPDDRDSGLPMPALLELASHGGSPPQPITGKRGTMSGTLGELGWRVLPIPNFWSECQLLKWQGGGNKAFIDFGHVHEWLIVPPDDSPLRARKVAGRIRAIRAAYRLAVFGEDAGSQEKEPA